MASDTTFASSSFTPGSDLDTVLRALRPASEFPIYRGHPWVEGAKLTQPQAQALTELCGHLTQQAGGSSSGLQKSLGSRITRPLQRR